MIPDYLIQRVCMAGGRRLDKKPDRSQLYGGGIYNAGGVVHNVGFGPRTPRSEWDRSRLPVLYDRRRRSLEEEEDEDKPIKDGDIVAPSIEFRYWEYRFWAVESVNDIVMSTCRRCRCMMTTKEGRISHHQHRRCTVYLTHAYKELLKDHKCVICDSYTKGEKFGVPVCLSICLERFFKEADQECVKEAVRLVTPGIDAMLKLDA